MNQSLVQHNIGIGIIGTSICFSQQMESMMAAHVNIRGVFDASQNLDDGKPKEMDALHHYGTLDEMLSDPEVDIVHIASPMQTYFDDAWAALVAGKHVVCEKPFKMSFQEAESLSKLAASKNLVAAVNFNLRMYPFIRQARNIIRKGELGELLVIQGAYQHDQSLFWEDTGLGQDADHPYPFVGSMDLGIYWLDLIHFITGLDVEEVLADGKTFVPLHGIAQENGTPYKQNSLPSSTVQQKDFATVLLHYQKDVRGILNLSQVSAGRKNYSYFEINGSKGSIAWNREKPDEIWVGYRDKDNQTLTGIWPSKLSGYNTNYPTNLDTTTDTFAELYTAVYRHILFKDDTAEPDFPTLLEIAQLIKVCDAIKESLHEKQWTNIP